MARSPEKTDQAAILDRNRFRMEVRRGVATPDLSLDEEKAELVARLTATLTPRQMDVLQMRADGLRWVDIGRLQGVTGRTAQSTYQRAIARIIGSKPNHYNFRPNTPESLRTARDLLMAHGLADALGGPETAPRERLRAAVVLLRGERYGWPSIARAIGVTRYMVMALHDEHRRIDLDARVRAKLLAKKDNS